jgi:hypothetical protein
VTRTIDLDSLPLLSARDSDDLSDLFPAGFLDLYEVHSYRNAARILATACKSELTELVEQLSKFRIDTAQVVASGGNKSQIAKAVDERLRPLGWAETRIKGDLLINKLYSEKVTRTLKSGIRKGAEITENVARNDTYLVRGVVDGHMIDFIKNRVAFDLEWNSKDQTFDRDLYAMRTFYECGIISAGIILTRSKDLLPLFSEIAARVAIDKFAAKFGASTTWMGKLTYRLNAGRAGGCPVLALGIKPSIVADFEDWKACHPVIREAEFELSDADDNLAPDDDD